MNKRETGARKLQAHDDEEDRDRAGLDAADNRKGGLMQSESPDTLRQSEGVQRDPAATRGDTTAKRGGKMARREKAVTSSRRG
ncbi:MAG: hypothetical protein AB7I79_04345 [Rhizobiaceae bacterium]